MVYKKSGEILDKLKSKCFQASNLFTYDFATLYATLPHNVIKETLTHLIEWTFTREDTLYLACNEKRAFFTSDEHKIWSCQNVKPLLTIRIIHL